MSLLDDDMFNASDAFSMGNQFNDDEFLDAEGEVRFWAACGSQALTVAPWIAGPRWKEAGGGTRAEPRADIQSRASRTRNCFHICHRLNSRRFDSMTDSVHRTQGYSYKENGLIQQVCSANSTLWIATTKNHILRWNLATEDTQDIEVSKSGDPIHRVFVDPTGQHCLISLKSGDNFYLPTSQTKVERYPRLVA